MVLLGRLFEWLSLDIYPVTIVVIMAGIALSTAWVPPAQPVSHGNRSAGEGFLGQLRRPGVLAFYACVALMQLSHGPYYTFLTLHLDSLGYSRGLIGLLWAVGVVAEVLMFLAMSRILARFSVRRVLLVSFLLAALRWLLLGALPPLAVFMPRPFISSNAASVHVSKARVRPCTPRCPGPVAPWGPCMPAIAGMPWGRP